MKKRWLPLFVVTLLGLVGSRSAEAQFGNCLICSTDAYGQNICVALTSQGPEGGTRCYAYVNTCITQSPCNYWA